MDFTFFDAAGRTLYVRNDAEEATWTQEEMSLYLLFPYDPAKVIQRGQRVGFLDDLGDFQTFEIRKAKTYEPDHYQEITAEHIVISELTDEHVTAQDFDEVTAQAALSSILTGTLWSVGTVTASNLSSAHIGIGNVWQTVRTLEANWNVYITPRVTVSAAGITGRYLDIAPAGGVWRGVRLSVDKNMDEVGVTWDDSNVKTAMYGYGKTSPAEAQTIYPAQFSLAFEGYKLINGSQGAADKTADEDWNIYRYSFPSAMKIKIDTLAGNNQISGVSVAVYELNAAYHTMTSKAEVTASALLINQRAADNQFSASQITYTFQDDNAILTFKDAVWTIAGGDPANKPSGQSYVEDAAATAAYGRNGRPRFGFFQNGDIDDPDLLLQKTWEALQAVKEPEVSIECMVRDLHRLGYADQPLRLHDTALVEIRPTGTVLAKEIIKLTVDLLDPTATRPTIGAYIPNIVYIARETDEKAGGGGGGGGGQTNLEYEISEFQSAIEANNYQISLKAWQVDMDNVESILAQAGLSLDAFGVLVYADDNVNMWQSKLNVQADRIGLVVNGTGANASIKAAEIVAAINQSGSSVTISADHILLDGDSVATSLYGKDVVIDDLVATQIESGSLDITGTANIQGALNVDTINNTSVEWCSKYVITSVNYSLSPQYMFVDSGGTGHLGQLVTSFSRFGDTIYYLGHT